MLSVLGSEVDIDGMCCSRLKDNPALLTKSLKSSYLCLRAPLYVVESAYRKILTGPFCRPRSMSASRDIVASSTSFSTVAFATSLLPKLPGKKLFTESYRCRLPHSQKEIAIVSTQCRVRRPENVSGRAYVDSSCIDCDTCRWLAPETFSRVDNQSAVHAQPDGGSHSLVLAAAAAAVSCPTNSIRGVRVPRDSLFPMAMDEEKRVHYLGFTNEASFAASSWLLLTGEFGVMIDVPRYSSILAKADCWRRLVAEQDYVSSSCLMRTTLPVMKSGQKDILMLFESYTRRKLVLRQGLTNVSESSIGRTGNGVSLWMV